jgi:hypothetical protein
MSSSRSSAKPSTLCTSTTPFTGMLRVGGVVMSMWALDSCMYVLVKLTFHSNSAVPEANGGSMPKTAKTPNGSAKKRKRSKRDQQVAADNEFRNPDLDMSTSPETSKSSARKKRQSNGTEAGSPGSSTKKSKSAKAGTILSPVKSKKTAVPRESSPPPKLAKNKACIRCREKKIKCDEAKPACNQCKRGL